MEKRNLIIHLERGKTHSLICTERQGPFSIAFHFLEFAIHRIQFKRKQVLPSRIFFQHAFSGSTPCPPPSDGRTYLNARWTTTLLEVSLANRHNKDPKTNAGSLSISGEYASLTRVYTSEGFASEQRGQNLRPGLSCRKWFLI